MAKVLELFEIYFTFIALFITVKVCNLKNTVISPKPYICTVWGNTPIADVANIGRKLKFTGSPVFGSGKPSHIWPVEQWTFIAEIRS